MTLMIFDTLQRKKVGFQPANPSQVKMYTCGPTVYNFAHIGNLRTYIFEDLLRRTMEFLGMKVRHVMNFTDIDDKTLAGALETGQTLDAFTQTYKTAFLEDLSALNIQRAHVYAEATQHVPQMIALIEQLIVKGHAYTLDSRDVFYRIRSFPAYGQLSHFRLSDLRDGASERTTHDEYEKETAADFVLWKHHDLARDGTTYWDSPWGKGRPGWHIECSAMAMSHLGDTIDIHCGGIDNIFPHHENEIAQSEPCTNTCFSRYWMHSAHLIVDGKKMSKSAGNFYTLRDLLAKGYSGRTIRWLLLQTHYRTELNFTIEGVQAAHHTLKRIDDFTFRLREYQTSFAQNAEKERVGVDIACIKADFTAALVDDLNISVALAVLFDFIRLVNKKMDHQELDVAEVDKIRRWLTEIDHVLGILTYPDDDEEILPQDILLALEKRESARRVKNWKEADAMRSLIRSRGFEIEDTLHGPKLVHILPEN